VNREYALAVVGDVESTWLPSSMYGLRLTSPSTLSSSVRTLPGDATDAIWTLGNVVPDLVLSTNTSTLDTKLQSPVLEVMSRWSDDRATLSIGPVLCDLICELRSRLSGSGNTAASWVGRPEPWMVCDGIACETSKSRTLG
jgi:hypothetical protein